MQQFIAESIYTHEIPARNVSDFGIAFRSPLLLPDPGDPESTQAEVRPEFFREPITTNYVVCTWWDSLPRRRGSTVFHSIPFLGQGNCVVRCARTINSSRVQCFTLTVITCLLVPRSAHLCIVLFLYMDQFACARFILGTLFS